MPIRIPWNQHEVALLIDAYINVAEGANMRQTAVELSLKLRNMAIRRGIDIDDKYRNVNGMVMQLSDVQYLFTNGKKGLSSASSLIRDVFRMYTERPDEFQRLLKEANQLTNESASVDASLSDSNEWKKLIHSMPDVYSAILKNNNVRVREFINCTIQVSSPCSDLPLSTRANNCLLRACQPGMQVQTILDMPLMQLANLRGAGKQTIQEILDVLSDYVKSYQEIKLSSIIPDTTQCAALGKLASFARYSDLIEKEDWDAIEQNIDSAENLDNLIALMDTVDTIGPELTVASLRSTYVTNVILPMLNSYIHKEQKKQKQKENLQRLISILPANRLDLPVMPFVNAWPAIEKAFLSNLFDGTMLFKDIPAIETQLNEKELSKVLSFLTWCQIDIDKAIHLNLSACIKNDKQIDIIKRRADGQTLAEISEYYSLTRERVRQIEVKVENCFAQNHPGYILRLISAERKGDMILTAKEIESYCAGNASVFLYLLRNAGRPVDYYYLQSLDAFFIGNELPEEKRIHDFVDALPDRIEENDYAYIINSAAEKGLPIKLVELKIRADYSFLESIRVWQRGKLSIRQMCRAVLPSFDPDGIHVFSSEEIQEFRRRLTAQFGSEARISETDRALVAVISDTGMLRDRGTYVAIREHILPDDLLVRIQTYINQSEMEALMFSTIYDVFQDELLKLGVDNRYYLQGILKHEWSDI